MLPIKAWRIYYADGSSFSSEDGTWAEAPPFGVQCVVWYHVDPRDCKVLRTLYGGEPGNDVYLHHERSQHTDDVYVYHGEGSYEGLKMGMWMDDKGLYRIHDLARASTMPKPAE